MFVGIVLVAVILFYLMPLMLVMLFAWLFSTRQGIQYTVRFSDVSRDLRLALLVGFAVLWLALVVQHFFPELIQLSGYLGMQVVLTVCCIWRIGWKSISRPGGHVGSLRRGVHSLILLISVLVTNVMFLFLLRPG
jgi:hypothetical protein